MRRYVLEIRNAAKGSTRLSSRLPILGVLIAGRVDDRVDAARPDPEWTNGVDAARRHP